MGFWIATAYAQSTTNGAAAAPSMLSPLLLMGVFFVIFWFIALRPQMKRAKEHRNMLAALSRGDEIVAAGGIMGRVGDIRESVIELEIADGVPIKIQKNAVVTILPKGTLKSL